MVHWLLLLLEHLETVQFSSGLFKSILGIRNHPNVINQPSISTIRLKQALSIKLGYSDNSMGKLKGWRIDLAGGRGGKAVLRNGNECEFWKRMRVLDYG